MKSFASDNYSGVHPKIMEAIIAANEGHAAGYGACDYTRRAENKFKEHFGENIEVYFVLNGTAANVLSLHSVTKPYNSVICADDAHINNDECAAPETFACKLVKLGGKDGKLTAADVKPYLDLAVGVEHFAQPKVISITQLTERGAVYSPEEIRKIADFAHENGLYLHMDGARISNAAAALGVSLREITVDLGVDILSFGGAKNGMMFGEAVVFFDKNIAKDFKYIRKNSMQLLSKMRFISAQFEAFLSDNLWFENANKSNAMAQKLVKELKARPHIKITSATDANMIFAVFPAHIIEKMQKQYPFYLWDESISEVRLVTGFDTTDEDVNGFIGLLDSLIR